MQARGVLAALVTDLSECGRWGQGPLGVRKNSYRAHKNGSVSGDLAGQDNLQMGRHDGARFERR